MVARCLLGGLSRNLFALGLRPPLGKRREAPRH